MTLIYANAKFLKIAKAIAAPNLKSRGTRNCQP